VAAGGAAEEVARLDGLLKTAALFFDLAAPVEFQAESVVLCVSAARGVAVCVFPSPVAVMAVSALTSLRLVLLLIKPAVLVGVDGGAVAPRFVDPPSVWGAHPVQGLAVEQRRPMPAARASRRRRSWNPGQGPICILCVFLGLSVRCLVNIKITVFAKKKCFGHFTQKGV
jgi:hypothetical protein